MELELKTCPDCSKAFLGTECPHCHKSVLDSSELSEIKSEEFVRYSAGVDAVDKVLSGGIVKGGNILLVGAPGSGKSTLVLQIIAKLIEHSSVVYFSLEEDVASVKERTRRLELELSNMLISSQNELYELSEIIEKSACDVVIIDSLQMVYVLGRAPFSSNSGRVALDYLVQKFTDKTFIIISCMNKSGKVAGSRILEHIVDVVLYIENENGRIRSISASKNRFGIAGTKYKMNMTENGFV